MHRRGERDFILTGCAVFQGVVVVDEVGWCIDKGLNVKNKKEKEYTMK